MKLTFIITKDQQVPFISLNQDSKCCNWCCVCVCTFKAEVQDLIINNSPNMLFMLLLLRNFQ